VGDTLDCVGLGVRDVMEEGCIPAAEGMDYNSSLYLLVQEGAGK